MTRPLSELDPGERGRVTAVDGDADAVRRLMDLGMIRGTTVGFGQENGRTGFTVKNPNFEGECAGRSLEQLQNQPIAK